MKTKYTVQYFIDKFKKIPDSKWNIGAFVSPDGKKKCALGWCGMRADNYSSDRLFKITKESKAFEELLNFVADINDGRDVRYTQDTPKKRILAALKDIKKLEKI